MSDCRTVYRGIIDEVVTNSREQFVQEGIDESVLEELRVLWEEKLQQSGVLAAAPPRPAPQIQPGYQYGGQYQASYYGQGQGRGTAQLGRPSSYAMPGMPGSYTQQAGGQQGYPQMPGVAGSQGPRPVYQTYQQMVQARPHAGAPPVQQSQQGYPTPLPSASGGYQQGHQPQAPGQAAHQMSGHAQARGGPYSYPQQHYQQQNPAQQSYQGGVASRPPQQMHPYTQQSARAPQQSYLPQSQHPYGSHAANGSMTGSGGSSQQEALGNKRRAEETQESGRTKQQHTGSQGHIYQLDGADDKDKEKEDKSGDEEEAVDNLSDVASSEEGEEDVPNQCLSQFTKVQRTKNRWKCFLSAGVMNLHGRDHVFSTAQGEFQF